MKRASPRAPLPNRPGPNWPRADPAASPCNSSRRPSGRLFLSLGDRPFINTRLQRSCLQSDGSARCWVRPGPTATRLRNKAQGWRAAPTLGQLPQWDTNRNAVAASPCARVTKPRWGFGSFLGVGTQGRRCAPTLRVSEQAQGLFLEMFLDKRSASPWGPRFFSFQSGGPRARIGGNGQSQMNLWWQEIGLPLRAG